MRLAPSVFVSGPADTRSLMATLKSAGFEAGRATRVTFTVLDTIDGRLHVNGLRLVATQADTLTLTLSGPASAYGDIAADSLPLRASDLPVGQWRDVVAAASGERLLLAQVTVVGARRRVSLRNGAGELRSFVSVDDKLRVSGRTKGTVSAVTVHRVAGKGKYRRRAEALCVDAGLIQHHDPLGEVVDHAGVDLTGVSRSPADLDENTLALDGFRSVLTELCVAVEGYWRGASHSSDAAFVHGLRVATRRSRSVLVEGKTVLPRSAFSMASAGLGVLGSCTGPARDLDVYLAEWSGYVSALPTESATALEPVRALLASQRELAYEELAVGLASPEVSAFIRNWERWLRKPLSARSVAASPDGGRELVEYVAERIARAHLTLLENGRLITDNSPATQVHDLRRDAKRLRYLLECFSGVLPAKATKKFVRRLKSLQDNLGAHQDTEVHAAQLVAVLQQPSAQSFPDETVAAASLLVQHIQQQTESARSEFSSRFAEYDSPSTQAALNRILVGPDAGPDGQV